MSDSLAEMTDGQIEHLVVALDSLVDGELAVTLLITCGQRVVPYLERFLLKGSPHTIALPRCRAVRALGELGAYSTLVSYFRTYQRPADAAVLFAEDAVRSAVARELLRWKFEEVFRILMEAATRRVTGGLVVALGEFHRQESIPLLFDILVDDLCRHEAKDALRKVPEAAREYFILSIRGLTDAQLHGPSALPRRRAMLQLLNEFGISPSDWTAVRHYLCDPDADVVIAAAGLGSRVAPVEDHRRIVEALFRISARLNWVQEDEVATLLDSCRELACEVAQEIVDEKKSRGERPDWLAPSWRMLRHVLGRELDGHYGVA